MENENKKPEWSNLNKVANTKNALLENVDDDDLQKQKNKRYKQDTHYRCIFSWWVIGVVSSWLVIVLVIIFFCGFGLMTMPSQVLIALLATTTVNILGLAFIVLKGIFPQESK